MLRMRWGIEQTTPCHSSNQCYNNEYLPNILWAMVDNLHPTLVALFVSTLVEYIPLQTASHSPQMA
jgi:hypothetical protein